MITVKPCLWYHEKAEEAAQFYANIIPNSALISVTPMHTETPGGPAGSVKLVEFTLAGQPFLAFTSPGPDSFNHSISLMLECDTQEEIDTLWQQLAQGGQTKECGWLADRYGLNWQITARELTTFLQSPDIPAAKAAAEAMLTMQKMDIATLKQAYLNQATAA